MFLYNSHAQGFVEADSEARAKDDNFIVDKSAVPTVAAAAAVAAAASGCRSLPTSPAIRGADIAGVGATSNSSGVLVNALIDVGTTNHGPGAMKSAMHCLAKRQFIL